MRIIVSDTSCMIDLHKVELLEELLSLPYMFVMPDTLFDDEWLSLTTAEKKRLRKLGLEVRTLPGPQVARAARYFNRHRRLKLNDCFALVLAEETEDSILLTGDGLLRRIAEDGALKRAVSSGPLTNSNRTGLSRLAVSLRPCVCSITTRSSSFPKKRSSGV